MNELLNNLIKAHCEMRDALKTSSIKSKSEFMQLFIHYSNSYENLIIQGNKDPQQLLLNIEKEIELRKSDQDILSFLIGLKYSLKSADEKARTKLKVDLFRKFGNNDNADTLMNATELLLSNEMLASEYNEVINTFNQKNKSNTSKATNNKLTIDDIIYNANCKDIVDGLLEYLEITINGKPNLSKGKAGLLGGAIIAMKEKPNFFRADLTEDQLLQCFNQYLNTNFKRFNKTGARYDESYKTAQHFLKPMKS